MTIAMLQNCTTSVSPENEPPSDDYNTRLQILLITFLRETKIPFSIVDNPRFQDIINHLNPNVTPPTFVSLLEMATVDHDKFLTYERLVEHNEIQKRIEKEKGARNKVVFNIEPPPEILPSNLNCAKRKKLPLNLESIPLEHEITIAQFPATAGLANWPCIVCLKRMSWSKVRGLSLNEATVFLYVCVVEGVYSIEIAKKLASLRMQKCCVDHFNPVYEAAMKLMGITDPEQIVEVDDRIVVDAYAIVKQIKVQSKALLNKSSGLDNRQAGPFRHSLRCFFKNYQPRRNVLSGFVINIPAPSPKKTKANEKSHTKEHEPTQGLPRPGEEIDFPDDILEPSDFNSEEPIQSSKYTNIENL